MIFRAHKPFVKFKIRLSNHRAVVMSRPDGTTYKRIPRPLFGTQQRSNTVFLKQWRDNVAKLRYPRSYLSFNYAFGKLRRRKVTITFTETYSKPVSLYLQAWAKELVNDNPF
jgi:hypothetical protein